MQNEEVDAGDLWGTILADAGIEHLSEVPVGVKTRWFPIGASKDFTIVEVGKPLPMNPDLVGFAIFQDESEVRVYACSVPKMNEKPLPPHRLTLSKTAPTLFVEMLALDIFIKEVSGELQLLADTNPAADQALMLSEAIRGFLENGDRAMLETALKDFDDDEDDEDDEEEEEEFKEEPNGGVAPTV